MKAFVTGAPGWLGTRLVAHLAGKIPGAVSATSVRNVRCLVEPSVDAGGLTSMPGVEAMPGDVADAASVAHFLEGAAGGTVFHCAGIIHPTRGIKQLYRVNLE